jgi:hypothetical protein
MRLCDAGPCLQWVAGPWDKVPAFAMSVGETSFVRMNQNINRFRKAFSRASRNNASASNEYIANMAANMAA